jgi:hypothetical protein
MNPSQTERYQNQSSFPFLILRTHGTAARGAAVISKVDSGPEALCRPLMLEEM